MWEAEALESDRLKWAVVACLSLLSDAGGKWRLFSSVRGTCLGPERGQSGEASRFEDDPSAPTSKYMAVETGTKVSLKGLGIEGEESPLRYVAFQQMGALP